MAKKPLPSPEVLRQLFRYEQETGRLFWLPRGQEWFPTVGAMKIFLANFSGREAGSLNKDGYINLKVFYQNILAHRAIWAMTYGSWPKNVIDHIDGCRTNNRIANLRDVTSAENLKNRHAPATSNTGVRGVHRIARGRYIATVSMNGRSRYVGSFDSLADAATARALAVRDFPAARLMSRPISTSRHHLT